MLSPSDLIVLPYDPQYSRAGVQYARDSLHFTYNRMKLNTADRLRKIVAGIAFEMAARRWLEAQGVAYSRLGATAFTDPDRFDLAIGGRRCDLKSYLIYDRSKIIALRADPGWALDAEALIPDDQFETERMGENDIYLFGMVAGLEAHHSTDTQKAAAKKLPVCLMHTPPRAIWANERQWRSLGSLTLKSNTGAPITVEIGGQGAKREAVRERLKLPPREPALAKGEYFSVSYLSVPRLPDGAIGLRSSALRQTHVVNSVDWANIWVYGQSVTLCGWMNKHDFRAKSRLLPPGSVVKQYRRTTITNRALPMRELRPMAALAELAKKYG